jgi:hypothetical protein
MRDSDAGLLKQLDGWYAAQCNGEWDFKVELTDTYLTGRAFAEISENRGNDKEAFLCMVKDRAFIGCCPPSRLYEVISIFLHWADGGSTQPAPGRIDS